MALKRNEVMDIAKGIGMLCIIAGHLGLNAVYRIVFIFHVPLFFLISGYFLKEKIGMHFIKRKAYQLIAPYIITSILVCIFDLTIRFAARIVLDTEYNALDIIKKWALACIYGSGSRNDFFEYTLPVIGAIWFLLALFLSLIIVKHIGTKRYGFVVILLLTIIGIETAKHTWLMWSIQAGLVASLFVFFGWKCRNIELDTILNVKWTGIITLIIFCLSIYLSFERGVMSLVKCYFPNGIFDFVGAINGTVLVLFISHKINGHGHYLNKMLSYIGRHSLVILCAHLIELNTFPWDTIKMHLSMSSSRRLIYYLLVFSIKVFWSLLCVRLISVLYGKRKPQKLKA